MPPLKPGESFAAGMVRPRTTALFLNATFSVDFAHENRKMMYRFYSQ